MTKDQQYKLFKQHMRELGITRRVVKGWIQGAVTAELRRQKDKSSKGDPTPKTDPAKVS